jgi:hypothetical protein
MVGERPLAIRLRAIRRKYNPNVIAADSIHASFHYWSMRSQADGPRLSVVMGFRQSLRLFAGCPGSLRRTSKRRWVLQTAHGEAACAAVGPIAISKACRAVSLMLQSSIRRARCDESHSRPSGGEGGIRTPDTVARMPHFECGAFNHSATSPRPEPSPAVVRGVLTKVVRRNKGRVWLAVLKLASLDAGTHPRWRLLGSCASAEGRIAICRPGTGHPTKHAWQQRCRGLVDDVKGACGGG